MMNQVIRLLIMVFKQQISKLILGMKSLQKVRAMSVKVIRDRYSQSSNLKRIKARQSRQNLILIWSKLGIVIIRGKVKLVS